MINKTTLKKYITIIERNKKKVLTCDDLSLICGDKVEKIRENLSQFNPLINFDFEFNIKDILQEMTFELENLEKVPQKKVEHVLKRGESDKYEGVIDYIYKNMTIAGGLLNLGHKISKKDIRILRKLLKKESDNLK